MILGDDLLRNPQAGRTPNVSRLPAPAKREPIAGFRNVRDAEIFKSLKTTAGEDVVIEPASVDSTYLLEAYPVARSL